MINNTNTIKTISAEESEFNFIRNQDIVSNEVQRQLHFISDYDLIIYRKYLFKSQPVKILQTISHKNNLYHIIGFYHWKQQITGEINYDTGSEKNKTPHLAIISDSELQTPFQRKKRSPRIASKTAHKVIQDWFKE